MTRPFRRTTLYLPGFDPFPARRYREIYRRESARQAQISGYRIVVHPGAGSGTYGWRTESVFAQGNAEGRVEMLVWQDLVRHSMRPGLAGSYVGLARALWIYGSTGTLGRLVRLRPGPVLVMFYPVAMLLMQLLAALLLGWLAAGVIGGAAGIAVGLAAFWLALRGLRHLDRFLFAHYLMHDFAFAAQGHGAYPRMLETRLAAFTDRLAAALTEDVDEVLVVGHSSGAHLAVTIMADLLRRERPRDGPVLALLTLGHVVPMASFLPRADRLRADLALLAESPAIFWLDVSAPGDPCCFGLCDPVAVSGLAGRGQRWPLVISAAFSHTLSRRMRQSLRGRWLRLHFQYLHAFDRPGSYDYFAITAGPQTLEQRFSGRASSPSRIIRPVGARRVRAA